MTEEAVQKPEADKKPKNPIEIEEKLVDNLLAELINPPGTVETSRKVAPETAEAVLGGYQKGAELTKKARDGLKPASL